MDTCYISHNEMSVLGACPHFSVSEPVSRHKPKMQAAGNGAATVAAVKAMLPRVTVHILQSFVYFVYFLYSCRQHT